MNLLDYQRAVYSQHGEDGIIEELCRRLNIGTGWFVEFGAWDGKHLSNTYHLVANRGWRGVFIEGNPQKYEVLLQTAAQFPDRLHTLCALVGYEGENKLDHLLARTPIPKDFDVLSIDIDSYDWQVWKSLADYQPKIAIVECNSDIPLGVVSVYDRARGTRTSFSALVNLGIEKGHHLVCHTGNCIFVRRDLVSSLGLDPDFVAHPEKLFNYPKHRRERILNIGRKLLPDRAMHFLFKLRHEYKERQRRANRP
jgi:hypothetical protein